MRFFPLFTKALLGAIIVVEPALSAEITGTKLLSDLSDTTFDCMQDEIPLVWRFNEIAPEATFIHYTAVLHGKLIEATYNITSNGRISSAEYGSERIVERSADGSLKVTRVDGRVMTCFAR